MRMRAETLVRFVVGCGLAFAPFAFGDETWVEDSFEDFSDGTLDASGQNIYVSHDGSVQTIHRFDLNQDGHVDLLFNSTHDTVGYVAPTLGLVRDGRRLTSRTLAVRGSLDVRIRDLNRDGHPEAVFCPNASGIQNPRRFLTILWGGPDGWPASRSNGLLPVHGARALAIVDLNRDEWPDIAVLNEAAWLRGQPDGNIIRVFWGGPHSYILTDYVDVGVPSATALAAADLDADGSDDLAVLHAGRSIRILWSTRSQDPTQPCEEMNVHLSGAGATCLTAADVNGDGLPDLVIGTSGDRLHILPGAEGRTWDDAFSTDATPATHLSADDLDGDGFTDLLLTHASLNVAAGGEAAGADESARVRILWGSADGLDNAASTPLDVPYATATATGDLDGDGTRDVAVAVYQNDETFEACSWVFFGEGRRQFVKEPTGFSTAGALGVAVAPVLDASPGRVVFANSVSGAVDERTPLYLYWGGPKGFNPSNRTLIPFISGYEASAADLNNDGFVDLLALCSGHGGKALEGASELGANIYWGRANHKAFEGPRTILTEHFLFNSNVADLDKDGYLDLVLGAFAPPAPDETDLLVIYYGSDEGYGARRVAIPSPGRSAICAIADYDKDSHLDIAVTSYDVDLVRIFQGSPQGFSEERQIQLRAPSPIALETADLNADGCLDLVVGSYQDRVALAHDTGSLIFWGDPGGFKEWNAQWLPGMTPVGLTVADWDGDGHLDVFSPHYHAELRRELLPSFLYWGSPDGFDVARRTALVNDSASEGFAGDFDRDGRLDLAVANHTIDGSHVAESKVYYNDGRRFESPRIVDLPTAGPHWSWTEDMGHIYDRSWRQTYVSSIFTSSVPSSHGVLRYDAVTPGGAMLRFGVRSGPDAAALTRSDWRPVGQEPFTLDEEHRALQYRATFLSDNGDRFPKLRRVEVRLVP